MSGKRSCFFNKLRDFFQSMMPDCIIMYIYVVEANFQIKGNHVEFYICLIIELKLIAMQFSG